MIDLKKSNGKTKKRTLFRNGLRSNITKYLGDKLSKKLNRTKITIPWSEMTAEDVINWPPDVEFVPLFRMNMHGLERLHELAKKDVLDFSPKFLSLKERQLVKSRSATPESLKMIREIETVLCDKLNSGTNKTFRRVPWNIIKKQDIINWPDGVPFYRLSQHSKKHLILLHKLRQVIFFNVEFLKSLSDPSFDRTFTGRQIIQQHKGVLKGNIT